MSKTDIYLTLLVRYERTFSSFLYFRKDDNNPPVNKEDEEKRGLTRYVSFHAAASVDSKVM